MKNDLLQQINQSEFESYMNDATFDTLKRLQRTTAFHVRLHEKQ